MERKETIIDKKEADKFITLCAWCECPDYNKDEQPFTKKWKEKKYTVSHGICEKCSVDFSF